MSEDPRRVHGRLADALSAALPPREPVKIVVSFSGGLDSTVLLHLVRFADLGRRVVIVAAHYDHGMRPDSERDARWVRGVCKAWGVELRTGRTSRALSSEADAREARYAFLEAVRDDVDGDVVMTAHHADDQAETVLLRALRGTGSRGLAGIRSRRAPFLARPLLPFWKAELRAYAESAGLRWREDATNEQARFARNEVRRLLPELERTIAPGARRALVRLARVSRDEAMAWEGVVDMLADRLGVTPEGDGVSLDRRALVDLEGPARRRILHTLAARVGFELDEAATRRAATFAVDGPSGGAVDLGKGGILVRELDRLVLRGARSGPSGAPLAIPDARPGGGSLLLAGREWSVVWGPATPKADLRTAGFDPSELRFPLVVRGRLPGDRIATEGGTKKVKKLLLERRVPASTRDTLPLVADAGGAVLWIPGVARAASGRGAASGHLVIGLA